MIRDASPDDLPRLLEIQQAALTDPSPEMLSTAVEGPLLALVSRDESGRVVGYILAVTADERSYIPEIAVVPTRQGQGHGSVLLATLCRRLRSSGTTTVRLTARADDERVRSFYESRDFETVDRVPDYYTDGGDGVIYERDL